MRGAIELPDVHDVTLILQHRRLIVINVKVVRRGEDGHDGWETRRLRFPVHPVTIGHRVSISAI